MEFDFSKLRGLIKEKFGSDAKFAQAMGLSSSGMSGRLNNKVPWRTEEIPRACDLLGIPAELVAVYFFTQKVR